VSITPQIDTRALPGEDWLVRVLYMHQYFVTRGGYTGTRSYEFSKRLLDHGHEVTMLMSGINAEPQFRIPDGQEYTEVDHEGIHVVPIAAAYNNSQTGTNIGGLARMRHFHHWARLAAQVAERLPKPDIVFATHTPLTIGLAGIRVSNHFKVPFVFEVRDLWPQALINCGALRNPFAIWYLRRMERRIYHAADHIIALSPGMMDGVARTGIDSKRITVIPNGSDLGLFHPDLDGREARDRLGLGDAFTAIYFGAMGLANGLEYVVEAARILLNRGDDQIKIILHGVGSRRSDLEKMVRQYNLPNVIFSNPVPDKADVARLVAACDVCLTIYASPKREQTWSPNKMFDALAAGRPVLINVPGWLGDTIGQNRCGIYVDSDKPESLADALVELSRDQALRDEMGRNARALAEREFARDLLAERFENVLIETLKKR
jgi:glycosyltransferase involved in cell wall biosynthesis